MLRYCCTIDNSLSSPDPPNRRIRILRLAASSNQHERQFSVETRQPDRNCAFNLGVRRGASPVLSRRRQQCSQSRRHTRRWQHLPYRQPWLDVPACALHFRGASIGASRRILYDDCFRLERIALLRRIIINKSTSSFDTIPIPSIASRLFPSDPSEIKPCALTQSH